MYSILSVLLSFACSFGYSVIRFSFFALCTHNVFGEVDCVDSWYIRAREERQLLCHLLAEGLRRGLSWGEGQEEGCEQQQGSLHTRAPANTCGIPSADTCDGTCVGLGSSKGEVLLSSPWIYSFLNPSHLLTHRYLHSLNSKALSP